MLGMTHCGMSTSDPSLVDPSTSDSLELLPSSDTEEPESISTFAVAATVLLYDNARLKWEQDKKNMDKYEALNKAGDLVMELVANEWELEPQAVELLSKTIARIRRSNRQLK
jgi:hypothetical protein